MSLNPSEHSFAPSPELDIWFLGPCLPISCSFSHFGRGHPQVSEEWVQRKHFFETLLVWKYLYFDSLLKVGKQFWTGHNFPQNFEGIFLSSSFQSCCEKSYAMRTCLPLWFPGFCLLQDALFDCGNQICTVLKVFSIWKLMSFHSEHFSWTLIIFSPWFSPLFLSGILIRVPPTLQFYYVFHFLPLSFCSAFYDISSGLFSNSYFHSLSLLSSVVFLRVLIIVFFLLPLFLPYASWHCLSFSY